MQLSDADLTEADHVTPDKDDDLLDCVLRSPRVFMLSKSGHNLCVKSRSVHVMVSDGLHSPEVRQ